MKTEMHSTQPQETQQSSSIAEMMEKVKETCEYCQPSTPLRCVTSCKLWRQKNELEKLHRKMQDPNYVNKLLNTLKNKRRQKLFTILSRRQHSITQLQQEMKRMGYYHSQATIAEEYMTPLIETGLAHKDQHQYKATIFGCKLNQLMTESSGIIGLLPPHSKCYEEITIESLSKSPKTYQELEKTIANESPSRVLKRLQQANLITKDGRNSYIIYFKTKRDSRKEKLSPTEKRVYQNIPERGISAQELSRTTRISLRRTYKYLRKLRGKKLAFKRRLPRKYSLTETGMKIAELLEKIQALLIEFAHAPKAISAGAYESIKDKEVPDTLKAMREKLPEILVQF